MIFRHSKYGRVFHFIYFLGKEIKTFNVVDFLDQVEDLPSDEEPSKVENVVEEENEGQFLFLILATHLL